MVRKILLITCKLQFISMKIDYHEMYNSLFPSIYLGSVIGDMAKESYRNLMMSSVTVGFVCSIVFYILVQERQTIEKEVCKISTPNQLPA